MKVFVAGATGAVGRPLVARLVADGHDVVGTTRRPERAGLIEELGGRAVVLDALEPEQVATAVATAEPDAIIHELTAIRSIDPRHWDRDFALTSRLRTEGTDHLLAAARAVGVRRFIAQSYAGWPAAGDATDGLADETVPLDPAPAREMRATLAAIDHLERAVTGATWTTGIVLRYGGLYGPGTSLAPDGEQTELLRRRRYPVVGNGAGVWSFVHVADAADATALALTHGDGGLYNIVDDDPAPVSEWLPTIARAVGAPSPWRIPRAIGRLAAGEAGVRLMTSVRGARNDKAWRELGWTPAHPSWRTAVGR